MSKAVQDPARLSFPQWLEQVFKSMPIRPHHRGRHCTSVLPPPPPSEGGQESGSGKGETRKPMLQQQQGAGGGEQGGSQGSHLHSSAGAFSVPSNQLVHPPSYKDQIPPPHGCMGSWHEQRRSPGGGSMPIPGMDTPPSSPGRMNPQAASFAPSHGEGQSESI